MNKLLIKLASFAVMVTVLVGTLAILKWLPTRVQPGSPVRYASVEDARRGSGVGNILVPSYFPQSIKWPPALVVAQSKPFDAVVMEFMSSDDPRRPAMNIIQSASVNTEHFRRMRITETQEGADYELKGRGARLTSGLCGPQQCSQIQWQEGGMHIDIIITAPPFTLIAIAESMIN